MMYLGKDSVGLAINKTQIQLIKTYIVPASWETDALGNAQYVVNTICGDIILNPKEILLLEISNNSNTSNYKGLKMITTYNNPTTESICVRGDTTISYRGSGSSTSFYLAQNSIVNVYKLKEVTPNA